MFWNWEITKILVVYALLTIHYVTGKLDKISLADDERDLIHLVSFGMYDGAYLKVDLSVNVSVDTTQPDSYAQKFVLTIDKTRQSSSRISQYGESDSKHGCANLQNPTESKTLRLKYQLEEYTDEDGLLVVPSLLVLKTPDMIGLDIRSDKQQLKSKKKDSDIDTVDSAVVVKNPRRKRDVIPTPLTFDKTSQDITTPSDTKITIAAEKSAAGNLSTIEKSTPDMTTMSPEPLAAELTTETAPSVYNEVAGGVQNGTLPINVTHMDDYVTFSVTFTLTVNSPDDAGLYSVFFHNCARNQKKKRPVTIAHLLAEITGKNTKPDTFLSAGDIPEPYLFFSVCVTYVLLSFVWLRVLRQAKSGVFKTHYVMLAVCYCKALSALFHGTNFYYIGQKGKEETAWAVIFYISYLMKTIMLFLTIMLVGTGWAFIKHIFSDKEKKLFLIALPLQVLVYISHVIMSETEVATKAYSTWQTISVVVDLLCCAAILMPVIWSIRHLTEASQTDGKAALNLQKLRLFKSLYVMVISYIYITRIVILIFEFTLPYQYSWLGDFFTEVTVLLFLVMLGYKFRPADNNPYFQLPPDSDDEGEDMEMAVTQSGLNSEIKRRNLSVHVDSDDIEKQNLIPRNRNNESSHEFD